MQQPINKNKQQTAVEQFLQDLQDILPSSVDTETAIKLLMALKRAKELEKKHHKQTWLDSTAQFDNAAAMTYKKDFEQYYNETYNK